jgi:hypothetical protein
MSCYEWERGSLKIPTADWKYLKDTVREAFNKWQAADYAEYETKWRAAPRSTRGKKRPKPKQATNRTTEFWFGDAEINFNNETKTVTWYVDENNHAREYARAHPVGRAFFSALDQISWTSRSGGVIVGNDEYNRDSDYEGGGGNYVTGSYGGIGKRERGY